MIVRFPFSSTLYCESAGRLGLADFTASIILFFSVSLTPLEFATSTFVPATGSYFLAVSRTFTVSATNIVVGLSRFFAWKTTSVVPAGWSIATVPLYLALRFVTVAPFELPRYPPDGNTPFIAVGFFSTENFSKPVLSRALASTSTSILSPGYTVISVLLTYSLVLLLPSVPPSLIVNGVFVTVIGVLLADSLPPAGVEVAVISPAGRLFVGWTVATPWALATASPITTPSVL